MKVFFIGQKIYGEKVTGGQRRFVEAVNCCGVKQEQIVSNFWKTLRLVLAKDATYVSFDERYLFLGVLLLLLRRRYVFFPRGNKLIHFRHSYGVLRLLLYKKLFSWLYSRCYLLVFQTKAQAIEFQEMYSYKGRYEVLPNNINVSWINSLCSAIRCEAATDNSFKVDKGGSTAGGVSFYVIGFMGGMDRRKGFDVAYEACNEMIFDGRVQFHVAGAEAYMFNGYNVIAHGFVSGRDLAAFYKLCDFIIIPSEYDSFPNVLLEALACGAVPLISRDAITSEILGENSILLFDRDPTSIKRHLENLINNPDLMCRARSECESLISKYDFDWGECIRRIVGVKVEG